MGKLINKKNLVISTRKYTNNSGEEKNVWRTIGEITSFEDEKGEVSSIIELFHMPGVKVNVWEPRENNEVKRPESTQPTETEDNKVLDENGEEIPF